MAKKEEDTYMEARKAYELIGKKIKKDKKKKKKPKKGGE